MAKKEKVNETPEEELEEDFEDTDDEEAEIDPRHAEIRKAFVEAVDGGADEDGIKLKMIQAGTRFNEVSRLYNLLMVDFGYVKSKEEKNTALDAVLSGQDLTDEDIFDSCSQAIMEELEVSDKSANAMIRQWCKKNEVEYFKKPKPEKAESSNFDSRLYAWIINNVGATVEELVAHLEEIGTKNTLRFKNRHIELFNFAQEIAKKYA
jgi:hypothetical protein